MRILIHVMILGLVVLGLLSFEDVEVGLPVLTVAVWIMVALTGLFLMTRHNARAPRRVRRTPRTRGRRVRQAVARRATLLLPPR